MMGLMACIRAVRFKIFLASYKVSIRNDLIDDDIEKSFRFYYDKVCTQFLGLLHLKHLG